MIGATIWKKGSNMCPELSLVWNSLNHGSEQLLWQDFLVSCRVWVCSRKLALRLCFTNRAVGFLTPPGSAALLAFIKA